jgi:hypothetical protein
MPLQKKFDYILQENVKMLKKSINITELKKFNEEKFSMIREMLDYAKCDKKTMLMSALGQGSAAEDEKVVEKL